ncbi:MAG TPA: MotA/TolQ/ExbB proton channel family protein [Atribacteraceae bacterium]|nr:MotA/TolQ/ExbB proton channel family protein [Atribacteraceae bacterium]
MDKATIIGLGIGILLLMWGMIGAAGFAPYFDVNSILITGGGTLAGTMISYRFEQTLGAFKLFQIALLTKLPSASMVITALVSLAEKARKEGLLALEEESRSLDDPFFRKGIQLVVDGTDPQLVKNILETELLFLQERHKTGRSIFETMGNFAPAFGLIGTLIGLVAMLVRLDDPAAIGPGMAVALLTTLYGAVVANLICLPVANKLKLRSNEEILLREVIIEGILSIQAGDNPRIVEEKLKSFFSPSIRQEFEKTRNNSDRVIPLKQENQGA